MNPPSVRRRARTALLGAALAPTLVLAGCGGQDGTAAKKPAAATPSVDLPSGDVKVPSGVTLTKAGAELRFGQVALVAYEPNTQKSSVLSVRVDSVQTGAISEFFGYQLDARAKQSRPYYVRYTVRNAGTGDLGRAPVPLLAVDARNTLIQPSSFNNTFTRCPSTPLPASFRAGKVLRGCLVFLVAGNGRLIEMSYRPLQAFEPITWKGTIAPVAKKLTKKPAAKKNG